MVEACEKKKFLAHFSVTMYVPKYYELNVFQVSSLFKSNYAE